MDHAAALIDQNRRLRVLLRDADWSSPVPTCPGWTLKQLLRHVGRGDRWAAQIMTDGADISLDPRVVRNGKPPADVAGALDWLAESPETVLAAVREVGPDTDVATVVGPRPAAWWIRRRLHEATVHRADASIALGVEYALDGALAADGIMEWLDRLVVEQARQASRALPPGTTLVLRATDSADAWTVRGTTDSIAWTAGAPEDGDVRLAGPATDLLLALVRRKAIGTDGTVRLTGDERLWQDWLDRTPL